LIRFTGEECYEKAECVYAWFEPAFVFETGVVAGAATLGSGFLVNGISALGKDRQKGSLSEGDAAILRFVAAAEILESDLWEQYWELISTAAAVTSGFASPNPATGTKPTPTGGSAQYTAALEILDGDMPQYINDNTDDEFSHANFLVAYLKSRGANTAELDLLLGTHFRKLPGSGNGVNQKGTAHKSDSAHHRHQFFWSVPLR